MPRCASFLLTCLLSVLLGACDRQSPQPQTCAPTAYDEIGPFYRPGAPARNTVGSGYVVSGQVVSARDCKPLTNTRLEFWLVNESGEYDDAHRATVFADGKGFYQFQSNRPSDYVGRLPHIHMMVTAEGHEQLITQHYPKEGEAAAVFNLVLEPRP